MSNRARKERKRAGERFEKPAKRGTPLPLRREFRFGTARTQERMMNDRGIEVQIRHNHDHPEKENADD